MRRTQVQLPDALYLQLKKIAEKEETSLAEIIRRASEYLINLYPEYYNAQVDWIPPEPEDLRPFLADDSKWRIIANENEG